MSGCILLTGATGFLGSQIARQLIQETDFSIVTIVRAETRETAMARLSRAWWDWQDLAPQVGTRIEAVPGDVSQPELGLNGVTYQDLVRRVTHILHAAATFRLDTPAEELYRSNVLGTTNIIEFAREVQADHGLQRLGHVSTAYVSGRRLGVVPEDALTDEFGFSNAYEQTKYQAECLMQAAKAELPVSIFRPGMIVGDSHSGAIKTFNTVYVPLRYLLNGKLRFIPMSRDAQAPVIPVDYVASAIVTLMQDPRAKGGTFHLTPPVEAQPTAAEIVEFTRCWAREHLGIRLPKTRFARLPSMSALLPPRIVREIQERAGPSSHALLALLPYLSQQTQFNRENTDRLLGPYNIDWREILPRMLQYATDHGFLHRSERTVHEQIIFRLRSQSRPVSLHDVIDGAAISRPASLVRHDMLTAAKSLAVLGIESGDRVAVVGLNSTRYLTIDVAIGLSGAVSVPLYYTSPVAEINFILRSSGAKLLLIGAPKLLEHVNEIAEHIGIVSFCREIPPEHSSRRVISWDDFLALGESGSHSPDGQSGPDDLTTIRYTSGTTGPPKGVGFSHRQVRWMAETVASLVPWRVRTAKAVYLSFLPMNHVVEGILGTYSPYYLPAAIDIYFLDNIRDLARTLPMARPTIFFAVPRVYERLWGRLGTNRVGAMYLKNPDQLPGRMLKPLVRRQLLRKGGLDRCAWLIAGSAPIDESLLQSFRQLGIEIHNAYGLTEAPLIAINRQGANQIGTVGQPLPETGVRLTEDGEILVHGPQVTTGYVDETMEPPVRAGWLATGDLGSLTDTGELIIEGRKKELIATSYGKKVQCAKIEALLRQIPQVAEVMLVGEGRPCCTALLWLDDDQHVLDWSAIDQEVIQTNRELSHAEQVKRWVLLPNDLSIEKGDLTANLKLKRGAVAERYRSVIDALYAEDEEAGAALHMGSTRHEEGVFA